MVLLIMEKIKVHYIKTGIIEPCDLVLGEKFLHKYLTFGQIKTTIYEIIDKIYNNEKRTLTENKMLVKGFLLGDASSRLYIFI